MSDDRPPDPLDVPTHRGGFGEFGGERSGLIERTFRERIIIVGMVRTDGAGGGTEATERSLDELGLLVDTAGADVVDRVVQRRSAPDPATYIGKGKATELRDLCEALDVDTVVFDDDLTPGQQANLERLLGRSALDRTATSSPRTPPASRARSKSNSPSCGIGCRGFVAAVWPCPSRGVASGPVVQVRPSWKSTGGG